MRKIKEKRLIFTLLLGLPLNNNVWLAGLRKFVDTGTETKHWKYRTHLVFRNSGVVQKWFLLKHFSEDHCSYSCIWSRVDNIFSIVVSKWIVLISVERNVIMFSLTPNCVRLFCILFSKQITPLNIQIQVSCLLRKQQILVMKLWKNIYLCATSQCWKNK